MNDPLANLIGVGHVSGSDSSQEYSNHPYINMDANTVEGGSMPVGISSQMLCGNSVLPMQDMMCHKGVDSNFSQLSAYNNQMNMMNNHSYPEVFPNTPAVNHGIQDLNTPSMSFEDNFQSPVEQNLIFNNPVFSSVPNCSPPVPVDALNSESYNLFHNNSTVQSSSVSNCSVAPHSEFDFSNSLDSQLEVVTKSVDQSNNDFSTDDLFNSIDTELVQNAGDPFVDHQVQNDESVEQNIAELNHVITEHSTVNNEDVLFQENGLVSRVELEAPVCGVDEQPCEENVTSGGNPELESVKEREESCEEDEALLLMNTKEDSSSENEASQVDSLREDKKEEFEKSSVTSGAMPFSEESMDSSLHCPQDMGDNVLSAVDESGPTKDFRGSDREESTEENDTNMLSSAIEEDEATTAPTVMEGVLEGSETSSLTNNVGHSTESNDDSPPDSAQVGSPSNVPSEDCEPESRGSVKDCLTAESSISKESESCDARGEENDEFSKAPISPMITMLDSNLGEDDEESSAKGSDSECAPSTSKACSEDNILGNVRPRRRQTRVPLSKSQNSVEDVAVVDEGWQSLESNLLTPSTIDKSITIPDNVLRVSPEEQAYYMKLFPNLDDVLGMKLHCTTCGQHIGAAPNKIQLSNRHKVLRVLVCSRCRSFYGKGKFPKDSDGSELYCRWCGQGGEVVCCSQCPNVFCVACLRRNLGPYQVKLITSAKEWKCVVCNYHILWHFRAVCWAVLKYSAQQKKETILSQDPIKLRQLWYDKSSCCSQKKNNKKKFLSQTGDNYSTSRGHSSEKLSSITISLETCNSSPVDSSEKLPSVTVSLETCNSSPGDSSGQLPSDKLSLDNYSEGFARGHFLFSGGNDEDSASVRCSESDDDPNEIDPSLFVQPVLEEPSPSPPRPSVSRNPQFRCIQPQPNSFFRSPGPLRTIRPTLPSSHRAPFSPVRFSGQVSAAPNSTPRIFVRSPSSLLRPGLVPLSKKLPNKAPLNENAAKKTTVVSSGFRGSAPSLSNLDGVRSMEQLEAIDSVPWFRDGIDNIRAVGFAVTKRLRDLEARFHTLKNKEDSEKVMALGKKLDRLTKQTSLRFEKIHSEIRAGCHEWKSSKLKRTTIHGRSTNLDPFVFVEDQESDWEDSKELSRPLEKIIIPISTAALQGGNTQKKLVSLAMKGLPANISSNVTSVPMSTSQRTMPSNMNSNAKSGPMSMNKVTMPSSMNSRVSSLPITNKVMSGNVDMTRTVSHTRPVAPLQMQMQSTFVRILPKPQELSPGGVSSVKIMGASGNSWAKMLHNTSMVDSVGNSVSITMTNAPKRKREDSDFVDARSLRVQELICKYNIQPCFVRLKRCDDLVASLQEQSRSKTVDITVFGNSNICNNDDDDDIQIIDEVDAASELLPTVLCTSSLCETIE